MAGGETPGQNTAKHSKHPGVFCLVKHDEMPSFRLNNRFRLHKTKKATNRFHRVQLPRLDFDYFFKETLNGEKNSQKKKELC